MLGAIKEHIDRQIHQIREDGLYKEERIITSPQEASITVAGGQEVLNFCANNYLGLADHPEVIAAAKGSYEQWGYGLSSVRFICGTQQIHKQLEAAISEFLRTEDTILYTSCFDANTGLFETLLTAEDAIISDELNHASIIDGVRLCKAQRFRYANCDMADLEATLKEAQSARFRMIATDGVFSMDGATNCPSSGRLAVPIFVSTFGVPFPVQLQSSPTEVDTVGNKGKSPHRILLKDIDRVEADQSPSHFAIGKTAEKKKSCSLVSPRPVDQISGLPEPIFIEQKTLF